VKMGEEKTWALKIEFVGLFEIDWKIPCHDLSVEFLNTYHIKEDIIFAYIQEKAMVIGKHLITYALKISNTG